VPVDIAFITVSYNNLNCLRELANFFGSLNVPFTYSLTVVDNYSTDTSQKFLRTRPELQYLQTGENLGYGRAINQGVAATDSKYVCVTNTDVVLNREALIALWQFLEARNEAGVCAPHITYKDGRHQGMVFTVSLFSYYAYWYAKVLARRAKLKVMKATAPLRVEGVLGAFFLIRRSDVPHPALFDEEFFFYYEDIALAHTLKNRGVPCFIIPSATIIHIGGQSSSSGSISFFYKSRYLYLKKFYGPVHARFIHFIDRARILRKLLFYSLGWWVSGSEKIKSKQRYYQIAWNPGQHTDDASH
jgi:N-acetylglucosaminyl-diphospho-decaprenol L-rhamnosyltransferase